MHVCATVVVEDFFGFFSFLVESGGINSPAREIIRYMK